MFYFCASRLPFRSGTVASSVKKILLAPSSIAQLQIATLKATHGEKYPYSEPYPYRERPLSTLRALFERTSHRFNENSKIILVEGNLGVGKRNFAKRLAYEFDLHYIEPPTEKSCFTMNEYKFDVRSMRKILPKSVRPYDLMDFYQDPHPEEGYVARLVNLWYYRKYITYRDAMKHLLNTGQGVVVPSSVFADIVFIQALYEMGWITPEYFSYYRMNRSNNICELYKPHLTIYLDAPIDVLKKRIAERKDPREVDAKNLTDEYLEKLGHVYKRDFLPICRKHGEVVEIDWTEVGTVRDMDAISEELQFLKLEAEDKDDPKFCDWNRTNEDEFLTMRLRLESKEDLSARFSVPPPYKVKELMINPDDVARNDRILNEHPAFKYAPGWNPLLGDKVLFKI